MLVLAAQALRAEVLNAPSYLQNRRAAFFLTYFLSFLRAAGWHVKLPRRWAPLSCGPTTVLAVHAAAHKLQARSGRAVQATSALAAQSNRMQNLGQTLPPCSLRALALALLVHDDEGALAAVALLHQLGVVHVGKVDVCTVRLDASFFEKAHPCARCVVELRCLMHTPAKPRLAHMANPIGHSVLEDGTAGPSGRTRRSLNRSPFFSASATSVNASKSAPFAFSRKATTRASAGREQGRRGRSFEPPAGGRSWRQRCPYQHQAARQLCVPHPASS